MNFREYLKDNYVYLDGGMGSLLQERGMQPGELPERWNISHKDVIIDIQKSYYDAGSNVVNSNTFGANRLHYEDEGELTAVIEAAIANAKEAASLSDTPWPKFVSLDIGPTGKLLKPYGDLDFEDAVDIFAQIVRIGVKAGADLITIETMNDSYETKAAVLAAKENSDLPIIVSNAFGEDSKLMTGASPSAMVAMLEGLGVDAIGTNCSLGPVQLRPVIDELLEVSSTPVIFKPNAGLPKVVDGKTVYDVTPDEFAEEVVRQMKAGVRVVGGCCGTTPLYIKKVHDLSANLKPEPIVEKKISWISSYTNVVRFTKDPILIGERLNPTGKKRFKQALIEHDIDYILKEGLNQVDAKVQVLDVNVGIPDIDEPALLTDVVKELQAVTDVPLQLDTTDVEAMERALRVYNGKAMINSVNGKQEVMKEIFPLVAKYGGFVVALTINEAGIPDTVEERIAIARNIIDTAKSYGIEKHDLIFDPLCMTISADTNAALTTLKCVKILHDELGVHTSLGVSNVSFGLPKRNLVNGAMFASALENGLSAAIMNPYSSDMMSTYYTYRAIHGLDDNCMDYIGFAEEYDDKYGVLTANGSANGAAPNGLHNSASSDNSTSGQTPLMKAICKGLKEDACRITKKLIIEDGIDPLVIVNDEVIPALNIVGEGFEAKKYYLPQLLMSAEAAKESFTVVKENLSSSGDSKSAKCKVIIATVKGDVHDIGKNIVKLLLENYGFDVEDLGKDVAPDTILEAVINTNAPICGLSALMTTTVPAMEETIKLIHEKAPWCKIVVGGAVLTEEYAQKINADGYSKDAMGTVRFADAINDSIAKQ